MLPPIPVDCPATRDMPPLLLPMLLSCAPAVAPDINFKELDPEAVDSEFPVSIVIPPADPNSLDAEAINTLPPMLPFPDTIEIEPPVRLPLAATN